MIIKKIDILNFRNYERLQLNLDSGINLLYGNNGQGKTNFLEAIYYLSCSSSHRLNDDKKLIKDGCDYFRLTSDLIKVNQQTQITCLVNHNGKNLFEYRNPFNRVSDFIGIVNAIMFCPDDMNLFDASPKVRRRFVDLELGKLSNTYTRTLNNYYHLLKERNAYLKRILNADINYLDVLNEQLIDCEIIIIKQRKKFIDDVINKSTDFYQKLSDDQTVLNYRYLSFVEYDEDENKMKSAMKIKHHNALERDLLMKLTTVGIHKDDFIFYVDDKVVSEFASQGQKRSIILSIKIGIIYTIYEKSGEFPILLLDDVFSELDSERRKRLMYLLDDQMQIFITANDLIKINEKKQVHYYLVKNGKMIKEEI